ncbi:MAG: DUF229 domain-containing protein [Planctomycetota bacterium]|nr:MAG: DUF229 domain-containing protein [Planctomycetota bacterium]
MSRFLASLWFGLLGGWLVGVLDSLLAVLKLNALVEDPLLEVVEVAGTYGVAGVILAAILALFGPFGIRRCLPSIAGITFGLLLFVMVGDWIHEVYLSDTGFFSPISLGATAAVVAGAACCALGLGLATRKARWLGTVVLLALSVVGQGWVYLETPKPQAAGAGRPVNPDLENPPNVLVVVIDTLRADRLGCYGYPISTSPNIDRLAAESMRFEAAYAQAPWTRASCASLFTGLYPDSHMTNTIWQKLPSHFETLPEMLHADGYQTACFSANQNVSPLFGFEQGFDHFWVATETRIRRFTSVKRIELLLRKQLGFDRAGPIEALHGSDASFVNQRVETWLDGIERERPYFLYIQYIDPHYPYSPPVDLLQDSPEDPAELVQRFKVPHNPPPYPIGQWPDQEEGLVDSFSRLYDSEIAFVDREFGRLLTKMESQGLLENTYIVVTSDHGEEFQDHTQMLHGQSLFDELVRVPLIIHGPEVATGVSQGAVELVDLLPTVAAWVGTQAPEAIHGTSLQTVLEKGDSGNPEPVFTQRLKGDPMHAVRIGDEKIVLIEHEDQEHWLFYNLGSDPGEQNNLAKQFPERFSALQSLLTQSRELAASLRGGAASERVNISGARKGILNDLGYATEEDEEEEQ